MNRVTRMTMASTPTMANTRTMAGTRTMANTRTMATTPGPRPQGSWAHLLEFLSASHARSCIAWRGKAVRSRSIVEGGLSGHGSLSGTRWCFFFNNFSVAPENVDRATCCHLHRPGATREGGGIHPEAEAAGGGQKRVRRFPLNTHYSRPLACRASHAPARAQIIGRHESGAVSVILG